MMAKRLGVPSAGEAGGFGGSRTHRSLNGLGVLACLLLAGCTGYQPEGERLPNGSGTVPAVTLQAFSPPGSGCTVSFPGQPHEQPNYHVGGAGNAHLFLLEQAGLTYSISYNDLPGVPASDAVIEQALDVSRDGAITDFHGALKHEKALKLDNRYPGREWLLQLPDRDQEWRSRSYVVGKRVYTLVVVGAADRVESDRADRFLESFKLTGLAGETTSK